MNNIKILSLLTVVAITLGISGCSNNESSGNNTAYNSEFEYVTLAELPDDIEAAKKGSYKTFKIGEHINFTLPEKISEMHITGTPPTVELAQKLIEHYGMTNEVEAEDDNDLHTVYLAHYINEIGKQMIIGKSGSFSCFTNYKVIDSNPEIAGKKTAVTKVVYIDRAESGKTITSDGNVLVVSELAESSKSAMNDLQTQIGGFECIPIYAYYNDNWAITTCARVIKGYYRPFCSASINLEKITPETEDFVGMAIPCRVFFQENSEPIGLCDDLWESSAEYIGEEYDKMISMTSALKYLDSQFAEYLDLDMDHACLIQLQKDHTVKLLTSDEYYQLNFYEHYTNIDTHPFWQFLFHSQRSEDERYIAIIDCITGKFSFTRVLL